MKRAVILQPGYLPWLGFFDLLEKADIFVVLDDVQYTTRDWRSRNRIKTKDGMMWLSVPVKSKGVRLKKIRDVEIENSQKWNMHHLKSLKTFYRRALYYDEIMEICNSLYSRAFKYLIDLDMEFIMRFYEYLSMRTKVVFSSDVPWSGWKDERLLSICRHLGATHYMSGDAAKDYLRDRIFIAEGIVVEWHNYQHPFYKQVWLEEQGFISHLSVVDLLFNHGRESLDILTSTKIVENSRNIKARDASEIRKNNF
jgi:hypothetical protein